MISEIYIVSDDGSLCYTKSFLGSERRKNDIVSFLTSIIQLGKNVGLGEIRSLRFANLNVIYSYDDSDMVYIITTDIDDSEEDVRRKLELIKNEFINSYQDRLKHWDVKTKSFQEFDKFTESHVFIPPKILLVGESGVGKKSIMNLFPGETIVELDNEMNEIIQKTILFPNLGGITEVIIREVDIQDLVRYSKVYKNLIDSADIICVVTNSGAVNLSRTKQLFDNLRSKTNKADFYIIANFQDLVNTSYEPEVISQNFGVSTFGFSAIRADAKVNIYNILNTILKFSIVEKIGIKRNQFVNIFK